MQSICPNQKPQASDCEELEARLALYQGLVRVSAIINSITDFDTMLEAVIDVSRDVFNAEAASLFFPRPQDDNLELTIASAGNTFEKPKLVIPKGHGVIGWVWEKVETVLIPDAYADERFYRKADEETGFRTRSILCAPLIHEGKPIAVLQVLNPKGKDAFDQTDLEAIDGYSTLIATALEKIRAFEVRQRQELLRRDLTIAAEMQQSLLARPNPQGLPEGFFQAANHPAQEVGGDFYLSMQAPGGEFFFAIGDVSGKGISAALLMTKTLFALEILLRTRTTPSAALQKLNDTLAESLIRGMFVTVLLVKWKPAKNRIEMASAGHCHPWVFPKNKEPREIYLLSALPIGILPGTQYQQSSLKFLQGDRLVLFSDGFSESRNKEDVFLGDRFSEVLPSAAKSEKPLLDHLLQVEADHRGQHAMRDDLTIATIGGP